MFSIFVVCSNCGKNLLKDIRHINENKKFGHNFYYSLQCQYIFKDQKLELICENSNCANKFKRQPSDISPHNFCSRSCAAIINNEKYERIPLKREMGGIYKPARKYFETWNNAISIAGFNPNPVCLPITR